MPTLCLLGALTGDVVGSIYEYAINFKEMEFPLFSPRCFSTDDTILTVAVADAILDQQNYGKAILEYARRYPTADFGGRFRGWMNSANPVPYNSLGNGSAMRASPVGWAYNTVEDVLIQAEASASPTHNHPEGIKGAQATALAVLLARSGASKEVIRREISDRFHYDLSRTLDQIRPFYHFNETCPGTVPEAILAFLESNDFEDAIRKAISLGGDADTLAAITGSIAEAAYGVPDWIAAEVQSRIPSELWKVVVLFSQKYASQSRPVLVP
jgi:ADP-ribosylglycohydrolase